MNFTLMETKLAPLTIQELDDNFTILENQYSTKPVVSVVGGVTDYKVGETLSFIISNYDIDSFYFANLPSPITVDGAGAFDAVPIGDGFNLFAINPSKLPIMNEIALTEHSEFAQNEGATSIVHGTISGTTITASDDGLSNTVHWVQNDWISIYLGFILRFTIAKSTKYLPQFSSPSRIMFSYDETTLPGHIWVVDDVNDTTTVYDATGIVSNADASILDVLGDGSCVDLWSFDTGNVYANHDGTNNFVANNGSFLEGTGRYGGSARPYQYIDGGAVTAGTIPFSGNVPATISVFVKHTSTNPNSCGGRLIVGTDSTRYNCEIVATTTGGNLIVTVHVHKRAFTYQLGYYPLNTYVNVMIVYANGLWEFYVDNVLKTTYSLNANWNNSKFTQLFVADPYGASFVYDGASNWESLRYFNKALNATERQEVIDAGFRYIDLVPPLTNTPTHVVYGTPPAEVKVNSVVEATDIVLETDGASTNTYKLEKLKANTYDYFDIEATFLDGELGYNTDISGYLEYTRPKNK